MRNNLESLSDRISELDIDLKACLVCAYVGGGEANEWLVVDAHWGSTSSPKHPVWEQGYSGNRTEAISFSRRI